MKYNTHDTNANFDPPHAKAVWAEEGGKLFLPLSIHPTMYILCSYTPCQLRADIMIKCTDVTTKHNICP